MRLGRANDEVSCVQWWGRHEVYIKLHCDCARPLRAFTVRLPTLRSCDWCLRPCDWGATLCELSAATGRIGQLEDPDIRAKTRGLPVSDWQHASEIDVSAFNCFDPQCQKASLVPALCGDTSLGLGARVLHVPTVVHLVPGASEVE